MLKDSEFKKQKAFFFLRHNNDIDHIVPVIYKWLSTYDISTDVIITTQKKFLNDYRIKYLKKFDHVNIFHISNLIDDFGKLYAILYDKWKEKNLPKSAKLRDFCYMNLSNIDNIWTELFSNLNGGIAVFDWVNEKFYLEIIKIAQKKGINAISLPHGDAPYVNNMTTNEKMMKLDDSWKGHLSFKIYDYVISPNKLCDKRFNKYLNQKKLKILGSPRYSDEWLNILSDIKQNQSIEFGENKIKLVLFLRNKNYPVFLEELLRTVWMISKFPNLFLIVKHHPRGTVIGKFKGLEKKTNIVHVFNEVSSDSLLEWADIILDVGTSIIWEPIKKNKPVLSLDYLHPNYSTSAFYLKKTEIKHRDQLYKLLKSFNKGNIDKVYTKNERDKFIKEIIDVPDKYILERYVTFLKECLDESYERKQNKKKDQK